MGAVYLAEETALGRHVAIKVVSSRIAQDQSARSRFLREARTLATIEHAHVVRVYTFGEKKTGPELRSSGMVRLLRWDMLEPISKGGGRTRQTSESST